MVVHPPDCLHKPRHATDCYVDVAEHLVLVENTAVVKALALLEMLMVLNGWKEIARHLGRGVRTVQRWESLGLPVHRPSGHVRAAVCAVPEELDLWLQSRPASTSPQSNIVDSLQMRITVLEAENAELRKQVEQLTRERRSAPRTAGGKAKTTQASM